MGIIIIIFLLIIGFIFVIKGADFLVDGASAIAKHFAIPEIVIGLTIVAFGTSTPELVVNIFASIEGKNEIVFGNILGSNIFNILLILGIAGLIYPISVKKNTVWREIPFSLFAVLILFLLVNDRFFIKNQDFILSRLNGIILLLFFILFLLYAFILSRIESEDQFDVKNLSIMVSILFTILGFTGLFAGGKLIIDNSVKIANYFNVSNKLIALTIVSCGTSIPELATSAVAAHKKRNDIAVGNVVGSNIFNILLILGISAVIHPVNFNPILNIDIYVLIFASLLLFITMFTGKKNKLDRWEALIMLLTYFAYLIYIIYRK